MSAPQVITDLVERFKEQADFYKSNQYKEASLRKEFLDPFFAALGWDMENNAGASEAYKAVCVEYPLKIQGTTKSVDYCFRIGGTPKFFVEAKRPSVNINEDMDAAYQLRRYAWNAHIPIAILTDFEEFSVYDMHIKPLRGDKANKGRVYHKRFSDYEAEWDTIYSRFSSNAVFKGLFDQYAEKSKGKRGTVEVDEDFLLTIEKWRNDLAHNIALRNALTQRELNFSVQRIIDRIIFLRICEDRGIEDYTRLHSLINGNDIYTRLGNIFREADARYNSGLFHFKAERNIAEPPDELTLNLNIDDKLLRDILKSLYYPESDYEFGLLPADVLGHVYEQFLGKVIRLTDGGRRAVVEEKPEVRKAKGVYYTPTYIVEHIVKETVGKLTEGKTPAEIAKLRILDPACGSGSFLIGAYQYLLDRHLAWYLENGPEKEAKKRSPALVRTSGGWKLTIAERKRILLNNIYGVDIDSQAVEVTKLSLLLKVLEGETEQSVQTMMNLFRERALPDLGSNIKCGNSLIGPDFYAQAALPDMNDEERLRVNVFDWQAEFPAIFKAGGFDAVIGNPPYRSLLLGKKQDSEDSDLIVYYRTKFPSAAVYKMNLFGLFMQRAVSLLREKGKFSFIIPNLFFNSHYFRGLRGFMMESGSFSSVFDLRYKVFDDAETGGSGIFVFDKTLAAPYLEILTADVQNQFTAPLHNQVSAIALRSDPNFNLLASSGVTVVEDRIRSLPCITLGDACVIYQGIITGDNSTFLSEKPRGSGWEKILKGRDINRYSKEFGGVYVLYNPEKLWSNTNPKMFKVQEKIISRQTSDHLVATYDDEGFFSLDSTHVIHLKKPLFSLKYLLGIYNSRLLNFLYSEKVKENGRAFAQVKVVNLKPLPIRLLDLSKPLDRERHNRMVMLAEKMLALHKQAAAARTPQEKTAIDRQISATDAQIDRLVYDLYGLTEEEIKIVEGSSK
ncbi:MAG TPA: TaqI-like C-terminal specificity domain-containing protein [bacterium]|nr:TaqI-like C-terminal specificity domain-containing protein [bacterium]